MLKYFLFFLLIYINFLFSNSGIEFIEKLTPYEKCNLIYEIGEKKDIKSIPLLINFLKDDEKVVWRNPEVPWGFTITTPGWESAKALVKIGKEVIEPLIEYVKKGEKGFEKGIWVLGELKVKETIPLILNYLKREPIICSISLSKIGDEKVIPELISLLKDYWSRIEVMEAIESFGKSAIPYLEKFVENKNEESIVRAYSFYILSKISKKENLEVETESFFDLLKDKDLNVRRKASEALIGVNKKENNKELLRILKNENDWVVKSNLIEVIGKTKDKEVCDEILKFLNVPDITVKIKVCEAIGEIGDKTKGSYIVNLFNSEYWYLRKVIVDSIGKIKDEDSYKKIIEKAKEEKNPRVIEAIIIAGGEIEKKEFSDFIISYITSEEKIIKNASFNSIIKIGDYSFPYVIDFLKKNINQLKWDELNIIADILSRIGRDKINEIITLFENTDWRIQVVGVNALTKIGEKAVPYLNNSLESKKGSIKYRTIQTIGNIGSKESVEPLIKLIKEEMDLNIKKEAINSLGKIRDRKSIEFLINLLNDEELKNHALNCLEKLTNKYFGYEIEKWKEYIEKEWK
jgi:HEAT repeat protein